jgi:hypothetical protein
MPGAGSHITTAAKLSRVASITHDLLLVLGRLWHGGVAISLASPSAPHPSIPFAEREQANACVRPGV